jgi:hypothetical protein
MKLSIESNFPEVARKARQLERDVRNVVMVRALNRTTEQARTDMSREIRAEFNMPATKVREKLRIRKATMHGGALRLQAELISQTKDGRTRSLNLINFQARQVGKGVSVKVKRSGARKVISGAFVGNKGRTVFTRVGKPRLPIKPVQTIDVPQMFNVKHINAAVVKAIERKFPQIFEREMRFALQQFGRGR